MGSLGEAMKSAGLAESLPSSTDVIVRVRRCYNAGSAEERAFQESMARIVKAYRLGHITEDQARDLAGRL
jgi:hypothetical protein